VSTESNSVTSVAEDTSYVAEAFGYLPSQFTPQVPVVHAGTPPYVTSTTRPVWAALVGSYALEVQAAEVALWGILAETLVTAVGVGLDVIGRIVGLARNGLDDTTYRAELYVQIIVLKSNAHPTDIERAARQFLAIAPGTSAAYTEWADAAQTVPLLAAANITVAAPAGATPLTAAQAALLDAFLQAAKAVGTRVMLIFSTVNDLNTFCFDDSTNPTQPASRGWGDSTNSAVGGAFASVLD
jgi:hypothetical protein